MQRTHRPAITDVYRLVDNFKKGNTGEEVKWPCHSDRGRRAGSVGGSA